MAKKRTRVAGYTIPLFVGKGKGRVRIPILGKTLKAARAKANSFKKHYLKNVALGFYDASGFHPSRYSHDYVPARAGEFPRKGKSAAERRALERKARGKMAAKKARKGRQAIS